MTPIERNYAFIVNATISLGVEVRAATLEEAIEKARVADMKSLCHQCASSEPNVWCTSGELDCDTPGDCELVDLHVEGLGNDDTAEAYARAKEIWSPE